MPQLLLGTNNPGKLDELHALLGDLSGWQLRSPQELGLLLEVEESGSSYAENASLKAHAFSQASGLLTLADDSGLEVEALNGAPGLFSARLLPKIGATSADRRQYLLERLQGHPQPWIARFVSSVCLAYPDGRLEFTEGECWGEIITQERGKGGFGYDPIFLVEGLQRTMAELSMSEKNQLSHRAKAILAMRDRLSNLAA